MSFKVSITRLPQFVQLAVAGPASIRSFVELVGKVRQETVLWSDRRVLVDLCGVEGELTPTEQVFLGEMVAQDLPHLERVASVVPSQSITHNSENAAQELGMRLRVFTSTEEATEWLTAPGAGAAAGSTASATN